MAIRVALNHKTQYRFDRPVSLSPHIVRLWPAPHTRTPILSRSLTITPAQHFINWQQDPYSNYLARLVFPEKTREFTVEVNLVADMTVINPFNFFIEPEATYYPFKYEKTLARELLPFMETLPLGARLAEWLKSVPDTARGETTKKQSTIDFVVALNQRLQKELKYVIRMEPGIQTCEQTLGLRSGSCRDSAWLLVQILRNLGLAARFVSGYLIQLVPDVKSLDGPSGASTDFTDLHAWAEVYLPGAGWIGLDPTSGLLAGEGHIPLACTADPSSAAPITGATDECKDELTVSMSVTRIHEDPRVTKPYSDETWREIDALGASVDYELKSNDVRLTMGGEPTFVGIDNPDDPEWNTTALGPNKARLAIALVKRLRERFAPGGLLHFGQGKWYPGESLPRWALGCYWRKDGEPVWNNPKLIADMNQSASFNENDASRFIQALAGRLEIESKCAIPGYEDVWHYMLQERKLPANVDPLKNRLDDAETRERISRIFDQGLNKVIGYVLPLQRRIVGNDVRWVSGPWFLRREHLFLIPGDSPMGLRLPLDSQPWLPKNDRLVYDIEADANLEPLPAHASLQRYIVPAAKSWAEKRIHWPRPQGLGRGHPAGQGAQDERQKKSGQDAHASYDVVRTALCVEPRQGHLHVFMPPQQYLEDYLNLIAAIEQTAAELETPVVIEGYTPPNDARLKSIKVTPDPGVIEVNIHPAADWNELSKNTEIIYEEAHQCRLRAEKFMLDGRHTGTGGGNHVIIGGATMADSPVLRRPDLLRSLISYWHNHPALSYLFSGLFIGPTSQHPRVDEARNEAVYELEIAFRQIPDHGPCQPWLVDRVLRNILIDATGNTHRTEFSIDKLYSPDGPSGRLGLVELRSFEMPPHYRMSLAQQVLLRAMIANFWRAPYKQRLVRWGTELHDRFMLPHFVEQDFNDVLFDLNQQGYALKKEWFAPHCEFRFPLIGSFAERGINIELRGALEPWHVMGEEGAAGGAVRYVDSSVERLQLKVNGMTDTRHVAVCNGRQVPLHPTGTNGEFVAGVRYRAWQPPSCLHPTIQSHAPLSIDLYDTWNSRAIAGCTYHVAHPGGRSYETFPINAYEAESRRVARFFPFRISPALMSPLPEERNPEYPFTLDLRR